MAFTPKAGSIAHELWLHRQGCRQKLKFNHDSKKELTPAQTSRLLRDLNKRTKLDYEKNQRDQVKVRRSQMKSYLKQKEEKRQANLVLEREQKRLARESLRLSQTLLDSDSAEEDTHVQATLDAEREERRNNRKNLGSLTSAGRANQMNRF